MCLFASFARAFTSCFIEVKKLIRGLKINKPLSGLLVYRRIMPFAAKFSSKFHICPRSEIFRGKRLFFGKSLSRGHYPPIYSRRKGLISKLHTHTLYFISCTLFCHLHPQIAKARRDGGEERLQQSVITDNIIIVK